MRRPSHALPDLPFTSDPDATDPAEVRFLLTWTAPANLALYANLQILFSEPLPPEHALWRHPKAILTPHIASTTQAEMAAEAVIANIRRHRAGQAPVGLVDPARGY